MASNLLGANTKKPLTWFTIGLVGVFLLLAILLAKFYPMSSSDIGPAATPPSARQPAGGPASTAPAGSAIPKTTPDMNSGK
jgi:preprotein translocase subunit SecG